MTTLEASQVNQLTAAREALAAIDALIDANRLAVQLRVRASLTDASGWQTAWDRCPALYLRERELFRLRYDAQGDVNGLEYQIAKRVERKAQREFKKASAARYAAMRCPACGQLAA